VVGDQYLEASVVSHVKKNIMEAKPIFIVRVPGGYIDHLSGIQENLQKSLIGYYVLVILDGSIQDIQFECFNAKDLDDVTFEELKKIAIGKITNDQ
jgi:hypothetical protein